MTVLDGHTLASRFPTLSDGVHNVTISGLVDIHGVTLDARQLHASRPTRCPVHRLELDRRRASSRLAGDVTEVVTFSEPMNTSLTHVDFDLFGRSANVHYAPASFSWDSTGTMLTINYGNLPVRCLQVQPLRRPASQDLAGNTWPATSSSISRVTAGTSNFTGLTPILPLGSLVYQGTVDNVLLVVGRRSTGTTWRSTPRRPSRSW